jgi:hypothetical protein
VEGLKGSVKRNCMEGVELISKETMEGMKGISKKRSYGGG